MCRQASVNAQRNANLQRKSQKHGHLGNKYPSLLTRDLEPSGGTETLKHIGKHTHGPTPPQTHAGNQYLHTDTPRLSGTQREHASCQGHKYISCYRNKERCTAVWAHIHTEGVPSCSGLTDSQGTKAIPRCARLHKH